MGAAQTSALIFSAGGETESQGSHTCQALAGKAKLNPGKVLTKARRRKVGIFPSFSVLLRAVFLHPKPHLQKPATRLHFGAPESLGQMGGRRQCRARSVSRSSPKHLTPLGERVPRALVKRWSQRLQGPLTDSLLRAARTSLQLPHSTNVRKPHRVAPRGSRAGDWGRRQQTGGRPGWGERPPPCPPAPSRLGFSRSPQLEPGPPGAER